jgi:2,5-diamino-6-(ribosylamino)-4(3H)-pyrimidinone 5'-phosphate reductase
MRPHVICHMAPSIDGRIAGVGSSRSLGTAYERTAQTFKADAWMIGRISMEPYAGNARMPRRKRRTPIPRRDFIANVDADSYAIAIDPSGRLRWERNTIDEEHLITILSQRVSDSYLAFLRSRDISYLFGGRTRINLKSVLERLRRAFGIKTLLLEGGGKINGSFLAAGLIDELSILVTPIADGSNGTPTLFDAGSAESRGRRFHLISARKLEDDIVWLRYRR